ncbi:peroxiredoxin family protein [Sphingobacterium suaedae]|uniref:Peroxiredoxin family protein n=1 Tax=Sphingobacterium suaedae TaxID=1686402 RepID=A0ABW5KEG9_9SPHI
MKYICSGVLLAVLSGLTACQSNNPTTNQQAESAQQETTSAHASSAPEQQTQPAPPMAKEAAKQIPDFKFYKVKSGISFTQADIPSGRNTVFILFDPNCGHCQHETGLLAKNYAKLTDVNIYFVSMNDPALMASFLETFGKELIDKPNVEVLYDRNQEFIQKFHVPKQFPANYVYGSDNKLKNNWDGEKTIEFLLAEFTKS